MAKNDVMFRLLRLVVRPVARFCVRRSLKIQDAVECLKAEFVIAAEAEMTSKGLEASQSRLSAMTGLQRREVGRILKDKEAVGSGENFISRVIGQWRHDPRFSTSGGRPRVLAGGGKRSEFSELVKSVSKDLNPYTILFELERLGYVTRTRGGLALRTKLYIPKEDAEKSFELLSGDLGDLVSAVDENVFLKQRVPNLHLKTQFDNVVQSALPEIRRWLINEGTQFQERARKYLSRFDKDLQSGLKEKAGGARVAFATFSFVESNALQEEES